MRRSQISFLLTIATTLLLLLGLLAGWVLAGWAIQGSPSQHAWQIGLIGLALGVVAVLFRLQRFQQIYFFRMKALIEDAQLILKTNPDHRLQPDGPQDVRALMTLLNEYAGHFQLLLAERDKEVQQARADLEEERNLLATLMADLSDGVVVCNREGRILLYNVQARALLSTGNNGDSPGTTHGTGSYVGLGRSIFGLLDRNALTYGLSHLQKASIPASDQPAPDSHTGPKTDASFITMTTGGTLLRTHMTPLVARDGEFRGFVLTLHDMTQRLAASSRRDFLLQQLTERMRGGLGTIRAAIELLEQFPAMPPEQLQRFQQVIDEEATALSGELDQTMRDFAADLRAQWRFEEIAGNDLLWAIEHFLSTQEEIHVNISAPPVGTSADAGMAGPQPLWLRVDSYAVVHGLATAIRLLREEFQVAAIDLQLHPLPTHEQRRSAGGQGRRQPFATLDVRWSSRGIATEAWLDWKERVSKVDAGDATLTLREVAEEHGGEVWFQHDPAAQQNYFRLLLPLVDTPAPPRLPATAMQTVAIGSRPQYYDFDLFRQSPQSTEQQAQPLNELTYTVFDTETTGLDPERDEIVSIGAVRVLNGRLLRQEIFDQLVDPQRPIPRLATEIHGIDGSMVQGQPTLDRVLPRFAHFAEETVLVGHNLAFDLRMFEVQRERTGTDFAQPVLDTLLLSEVIHPDVQNHALEAIAERLGVNVMGRHTALGDAFVTAEVFLRMIPLLNLKGIITLADALAASKATYLARVQY